MKALTVLFLLAISAQAFAKNQVEIALESKSDKSPYEILKEFHNSEGSPVTINEMNRFDMKERTYVKNFQSCVRADSRYFGVETIDLYLALKNKIIPAVPAKGPLFPGTPEQVIPQMALSYDLNSAINNTIYNYLFESTYVSYTEDAMRVSYMESGYVMIIMIKRHGDLISFSQYSTYSPNDTDTLYGYCWNE